MKLLTYTPPEERLIPTTADLSHWYDLDIHDPWWREALVSIGCKICAFGGLFAYRDNTREIGPLDHIRWFIEGLGERILSLGLKNSATVDCMIINSEIPWDCVSSEDKRRLIAAFPECFHPTNQNE